MDRRLGWHINELLLVVIILFQILDFFKLLNPFWDYVKKIVSWALIGYLFYLTSPSVLFFGERKGWWDTSVILAYFSLTLKNIIGFADVAREKMLTSIMSYVTFIPTTDAVQGVMTIPVSEGIFNAFSLGMTPLVNVSQYTKPFVALLTMNNPNVPFTIAAGEQTISALLQPFGLNGLILQFYNSLIMHAGAIERVSFLIGAGALLILGIYAALRFPVKEQSVLGVLHEHGPISGWSHGAVRLFSVLFVMTAFFVILFNLIVEWLAIAVDAPLAMIGIAVYLLLAVQFHRKTHPHFKEGEVLTKVGGFGTNFLKDFAKLFTNKNTVLIGLSGLLVLHLLVDIGTFIIPYSTGFVDPLYFGHLGAGHDTIPALMGAAWSSNIAQNMSLFTVYAFNTIGILALLGLPAYIWYKVFRLRTRPAHEAEHEHHPELPGWLVALCLSGISTFLMTPAFSLSRITSEVLIGVDLQTMAIEPVLSAAIIPAIIFIGFLILSLEPHVKRLMMALLFGTSIIFFGVYIYQFFMATVGYYIAEGVRLLTTPGVVYILLGVLFFVMLVMNLLFYTVGFLSFLYESVRD